MNAISKTILLVEDEAIISLAQKMTLQKYGYAVITANSGEQAVEIFTGKDDIDLILMDIDLGEGLNGPEAAKIILEKREIPVVFLSSHTEPEIVAKTEEITSYGYVVKNSGITVLDASIKMAFKLFDAKNKEKAKEDELKVSEAKFRQIYENMYVGIAQINMDFRIEFANRAYCRMLGFEESELQGKHLGEITHPEIIEDNLNQQARLARGEIDHYQMEKKFINKQGETVYGILDANLIKDSQGNPAYFLGSVLDITKRKKTESDLKRQSEINEQLFRASEMILKHYDFNDVARNIFDSVCTLTGAVSGYVALLNEAGNANEVLFLESGGDECTVDPSLPMPVRGLRAVAYKTGKPVFDNNFSSSEWMKFMPHGHSPLNNVLFAPIKIDGKSVGLLGIANKPENFTDDDLRIAGIFSGLASVALHHSRTIALLKESESKFRRLFESANDSIFLHEIHEDFMPGKFFEVNDRACEMLQYTKDELLSFSVIDIAPAEVWGSMPAIMDALIEKRKMTFESKQVRKDGTVFPVEVSSHLFEENGRLMNLSHVRDITERKRTEKELLDSQARFKALHNASFGGIAIHDKGVILDCNQGLSDMTGYSLTELIGMEGLALISEQSREVVMNNIISGYDKPYEAAGFRKNGEEYPLRIEARNIPYKGRTVRVTEFRDITDQKIAEEKIHSLLIEKEVLLKEIHHRIKNNMNIVYGLLIIQAEDQSDSHCRDILKNAASRIQSMMVLYDKLYRSGDYNKLDISDYLPALIDEIISQFNLPVLLKRDVHITELVLSEKFLSPLGIIINELITNSMKYAFKDNTNASIYLSVSVKDNLLSLIYKDSGPGLPDSVTFENPKGFGMQLISMLSEQIGGNIRIERGDGAEFVLEFMVE